jgi:hypothetical protein
MHFLKSACLFPLLILILGGCKPQAALTPQAAFYDLKNAFYKSDAALLERQLSGRSIKKIRRMTLLFSRMEDRQLESLSKKFGLPPERLKNLSARDYSVAGPEPEHHWNRNQAKNRRCQQGGKPRDDTGRKWHGAGICQGRAVLEV